MDLTATLQAVHCIQPQAGKRSAARQPVPVPRCRPRAASRDSVTPC